MVDEKPKPTIPVQSHFSDGDLIHALAMATEQRWNLEQEARFLVTLHKLRGHTLDQCLEDVYLPARVTRAWAACLKRSRSYRRKKALRGAKLIMARRRKIYSLIKKHWEVWDADLVAALS